MIVTCASVSSGAPPEPGRLTGSVRFQGTAVSKALVVAASPSSGQKSALTDAEGNYAINLSAGTYLLTVVHPVYVVDDGGFGCKLTEIKADANLTVDFSLTRGGVIDGTISDTRGQPLVGQRVLYEIVNKPFHKPCLVAGQDDIHTDDQGAFRIFGLPSGQYRVSVGREEYRDIGKAPGPFRATYYPGVTEEVQAEIIDVSPGQETKLQKFLAVTSPQSFSVEVTSIDEDSGDPLPAVDFDVISVVKGAAVNRTPLKTQGTGSVEIRNLDPGQYRILSPVRNGESPVKDCGPVSFEITDRDLKDVTIRCGGNGLSITGRVTVNDRSAATGSDCAIALKEGEDLLGNDVPTYSVKLGAQGSFALNGLRKTLYTLVVLPLKPSLEYEYVQIDGQVFHDRQIFGKITIDLRTGSKTVVINLIQK